MTTDRDNIIRLANEAAMPLRVLSDDYCDAVGLPRGSVGGIDGVTIGDVERFAALVIADFLQRTGQYVTNDATRAAVVAEAVAAEREACAQLVDPTAEHRAEPSGYLGGHEGVDLLEGIASRIRARSTP